MRTAAAAVAGCRAIYSSLEAPDRFCDATIESVDDDRAHIIRRRFDASTRPSQEMTITNALVRHSLMCRGAGATLLFVA